MHHHTRGPKGEYLCEDKTLDERIENPPELDVATVNAVLAVIDQELARYAPGSPEAAVLWRLKERLSE